MLLIRSTAVVIALVMLVSLIAVAWLWSDGDPTTAQEAETTSITGFVDEYTSFNDAGAPVYSAGDRCDQPNAAGGTLVSSLLRVIVYGDDDQVIALLTASEPLVTSTTSSSVSCRFSFSGDLPSDQASWQFVVSDSYYLDRDLLPLALTPDEAQAAMAAPDGLIIPVSTRRMSDAVG